MAYSKKTSRNHYGAVTISRYECRNAYNSTSGQKSDVTVVFADPDFLWHAGILAIRGHLRQILRFSYLHWFSGPLDQKMAIFRGKIGEGWGDIDPQRTRSYFGGFTPLCQIWWKSTKKCDRESDDTRTDRQTDRQTQTDFIICPIAVCYSYGADNKKLLAPFICYNTVYLKWHAWVSVH